jgi:hypothetical protein
MENKIEYRKSSLLNINKKTNKVPNRTTILEENILVSLKKPVTTAVNMKIPYVAKILKRVFVERPSALIEYPYSILE